MSVLKNKRGLSKLEFYHNARKLREDITALLVRGFGVQDAVDTIDTEENYKVRITKEYPPWLIAEFRRSLMEILRKLMMNITAGNTIYPATVEEAALRRQYQTGAVINCEQLLQEMEYCADVLPEELKKLLPMVGAVELEIKLLKGWRKSTNELVRKLGAKKI